MSNLPKCSKCGGVVISESFEGHTCDTPTMDRKSYDSLWHISSKAEGGEETLFVKTKQGILFTFVQKVRSALPTELKQPDRTTEGETEPSR